MSAPHDPQVSSIVSRSVSGIGYLVLLNALQRLATFALNQIVLRHLDPTLVGLASLHFDLFTATALFLSRESFRLAFARLSPGLTRKHRATSWLVVPFGIVVALLLLWVYWTPPEVTGSEGDAGLRHYDAALWIYLAAVVVELASEPDYLVAQNELLYRLRAWVEGAAVAVRSAATLGLVMTLGPDPRSFAFAQLLYAIVLFCGYRSHAVMAGKKEGAAGGAPGGSGIVDFELLKMVFKFLQQAVLKLVLTEGDRIIISLFSSLSHQGVYSLVANYGSLVARLVFLPLEETSRNIFSKLLPNQESAKTSAAPTAAMSLGMQTFGTVLKLALYIGLIFVSFGPNYSFSLLDILLGSKWSHTEAPVVLAWYFAYVLTMALNGITEAFVMAVANRDQITYHNYCLVACFAAFSVSASVLMPRFGSSGLVMANCINMICRSLYSLWFISRYFRAFNCAFSVRGFFPRTLTMVCLGICFGVTRLSAHYLSGRDLRLELAHVLVGGVIGFSFLVFTFFYERTFVRDLRDLAQTRRDSGTAKLE